MLMTRGVGWFSPPKALARKRSAAAASRLAERRKSIVAPVESTARYKYTHSVGVSKTMAELEVDLSIFQDLLARARKCRMTGSAALDLAYVELADSMLTSNGA